MRETQSEPNVTICIPTLTAKRLGYLREAVESARGQSFTGVEILISDDGRDPEIQAYAREQELADTRVRYRRNKIRLGLGGNWNAAVQDARGTYFVIIGDDDRLLPRFVETLLAARRPDTAVVFSNHHVIDASGARRDDLTLELQALYRRDALLPGPVADAPSCVWRNQVPMLASLTRTADAKRLQIRTDLNTPEIELFARLAAEGKEFVFVPEYLAEYRVHAQSATASGLAFERLVKYMDDIPVPSQVEPTKAAFMASLLVGTVNRALREGDVGSAREAMRHRYYPAWRSRLSVVAAQRLIASMSPGMAAAAFKIASGARRRLRRVTGA